jgi:outer membrane protein assembly factor BamB
VAGDRRWLVVAGALVGVAALLAGASVALGDLSLPRAGGDPAVSLPDAEEMGEDRSLDPEEREAALAPFDPDRISCAPAGCEVWRRSLGGMPPPSQWVVGRPVVIEDDHLVGIDPETGLDRWRLPIEDELHDRADGPVDLSIGRAVLAGDDELVVLATSQGVQLVTQATGETRWSRSLPAEGAHLMWAHATGTSVLVAHEAVPVGRNHQDEGNGSEASPDVSVTVLDTRNGQLRWSKGGFRHLIPLPTLADQEGLLLVGADESVRALELATGEPRYELPGGPDLWPHHHAGGLLGIDDLGAGTSSLVSASDGTVRAELPGAARSMLEFDGLVLALLQSGGAEPGAPSREVVAFDPDGSIAWRHPLERVDDERCCPSMLDIEGRWVRISDGPGASALVVDAGDGSVRADDPLGAAEGEEVADEWQVGYRLLMQHPVLQDAGGYVLRDSSGRSLQITGRGWPDPSNPGTSDIVLLTNGRELVAVRFP